MYAGTVCDASCGKTYKQADGFCDDENNVRGLQLRRVDLVVSAVFELVCVCVCVCVLSLIHI